MIKRKAAASARLCVETSDKDDCLIPPLAAASARLCVETLLPLSHFQLRRQQPPSGGCVLKPEISECRNGV